MLGSYSPKSAFYSQLSGDNVLLGLGSWNLFVHGVCGGEKNAQICLSSFLAVEEPHKAWEVPG